MRNHRPRQVLSALLLALGIWTLLDSVALYGEAQVSPLGARRTVALAVLGPLARLAETTRLDWPLAELDRALGRPAPEGPGPLVPTPVSTGDGSRRRAARGASVAPDAGQSGPWSGTARVAATVTAGPPASPTAAGPLRVLVIGDSLGRDLGEGLAQVFAGSETVSVLDDARSATGLARPDYFDWPGQLRRDLAARPADLVIVLIGGNDAQPFMADGGRAAFASPQWDRTYRERVDSVLQEADGAGARVVWVGVPVCASASFSSEMAHIDTIFRSSASGDPDAMYFDTWSLFETASGSYSAYLPDGTGRPRLVRQPDGIHLTVDGVTRLESALLAAVRSKGWMASSASGG